MSDAKFEVGGYAYCMWGYDQTNVDWFKVVRKTDKSVWFEEIQAEKHYEGSMHGSSRPLDVPKFRPDYVVDINGDYQRADVQRGFRRLIQAGYKGEVAAERFGNIYPWDGHPKHFSEWA
jgi:hypothetical protein